MSGLGVFPVAGLVALLCCLSKLAVVPTETMWRVLWGGTVSSSRSGVTAASRAVLGEGGHETGEACHFLSKLLDI